jgi:hypothetical protein
MVTWVSSSKDKDLRPVMNEIRKFDSDDISNGWSLYKKQLKEVKSDTPSENGLIGNLVNQGGSVLRTLLGGDFGSNRNQQIEKVRSIEQLEYSCDKLAKALSSEYKRFQKYEKKLIDQHIEQFKKHQQELENQDFTLMDYMTGNVPQPGEQVSTS